MLLSLCFFPFSDQFLLYFFECFLYFSDLLFIFFIFFFFFTYCVFFSFFLTCACVLRFVFSSDFRKKKKNNLRPAEASFLREETRMEEEEAYMGHVDFFFTTQ